MSTRLIQLQSPTGRRLALVEEPNLRLLDRYLTTYDLATAAIQQNTPVSTLIQKHLSTTTLPYDDVYAGQSDHRILPPFDHPADPARCIVSGTGLTHLGSAKDRDAMHTSTLAASDANLTDSMKMFRWGLKDGKPPAGKIGIPPEWFFKGSGAVLLGHNAPLNVPPFADGGGEEAEIAGLYLIDSHGTPHRIGMAQGNEFADQAFEKKNYLNLAGAKLRTCSIGPELVINPDFASVPGQVAILRGGQTLWSKPQLTGEAEMSHSLANIEHHLFKFPHHRLPGFVHVHYFGTSGTSFGAGLTLQQNDLMQISFQNFGRPLQNPLHIEPRHETLIAAVPLK